MCVYSLSMVYSAITHVQWLRSKTIYFFFQDEVFYILLIYKYMFYV